MMAILPPTSPTTVIGGFSLGISTGQKRTHTHKFLHLISWHPFICLKAEPPKEFRCHKSWSRNNTEAWFSSPRPEVSAAPTQTSPHMVLSPLALPKSHSSSHQCPCPTPFPLSPKFQPSPKICLLSCQSVCWKFYFTAASWAVNLKRLEEKLFLPKRLKQKQYFSPIEKALLKLERSFLKTKTNLCTTPTASHNHIPHVPS